MRIKQVDAGLLPTLVKERKGVEIGANQRPKVWHPGQQSHASQEPKKNNGANSSN